MAASSNGCFAHQQVGGPWPEEGKRWSTTHQCKYSSPTASEASPPPEYGTLDCCQCRAAGVEACWLKIRD